MQTVTTSVITWTTGRTTIDLNPFQVPVQLLVNGTPSGFSLAGNTLTPDPTPADGDTVALIVSAVPSTLQTSVPPEVISVFASELVMGEANGDTEHLACMLPAGAFRPGDALSVRAVADGDSTDATGTLRLKVNGTAVWEYTFGATDVGGLLEVFLFFDPIANTISCDTSSGLLGAGYGNNSGSGLLSVGATPGEPVTVSFSSERVEDGEEFGKIRFAMLTHYPALEGI